jgi:chromosome segregation ATPase
MLRIIIALLSPLVAHAQHAEAAEELEYMGHEAYVIQVGGGHMSQNVINILAGQLKPRLPDWGDVPPAKVAVQYQSDQMGALPLLKLSVQAEERAGLRNEQRRHELWDLARRQLEQEMQRVAKLTFETQFAQLEQELNKQQVERKKLEEQTAKLIEQIAMLEAETAGTDRESLAKAIAEAVSNQRGLQLEAAGIQARREAIEKRIDELRMEAGARGDSVAEELEKVVELRIKAKEVLEEMVATGRGSKSKLLEAESAVAEAKIEWLRAQRDAENRIGGGALRELNNELSKLLVEAAKVSGQQKQLEQIIAELRKQVVSTAQASATLLPLKDKFNAIAQQRRRVDEEFAQLQSRLNELSEPSISLKPLVEDKSAGEPEASAPGGSAAEDSTPDQP